VITARPLTCKEVVELVTDYLEDALPPEDRQRFEEHLALCDGCATYVEQIKQTIDTVGAVHEEAIDPEVQEQLLEAFRNWLRK
jgi:anti-sigma factor RsiW